MSDIKEDFVYHDNLAVTCKMLRKMLDNKEFSDTVFLVNDDKIYACSELLSAASKTFQSLLSSVSSISLISGRHKEIPLTGIHYKESFLIILRYIYGLMINFSKMNKAVMCEVLHLCDTYDLPGFFYNDLKKYMFKLQVEDFNIDSMVAMLNTARKFELKGLYDTLTIFVNQNAEQLVKHKNFVDLNFNILLCLLKSNYFYVSECAILKSVLKWHRYETLNNNLYKETVEYVQGRTDDESDVEDEDVEDEAVQSDKDTQADSGESGFSLDDADLGSCSDDLEDEAADVFSGLDREKLILRNCVTMLKDDKPNIFNENMIDNSTLKTMFLEKVLETLLSQIRLARLSALDLYEFRASYCDLYGNYKEKIKDEKNFLMTRTPRVEQTSDTSKGKLFDVYKIFGVQRCYLRANDMNKSEDTYTYKDLEFTLYLQFLWENPQVYKIFFNCSSNKLENWKCSILCQVRMLSRKTDYPTRFLPEKDMYKTVSFDANNPQVEVGTLSWDSTEHWESYVNFGEGPSRTFQVHFQSIHVTFN